ncbi:hypothetical protein CQW23_19066 [Capsicum baccatum]|uniref:NB-ARC domain-containing protein n=1 Tax=Capsicum baccatum TaxID=33114 RepID=A0A2G2W4Q6_CAPBA|nr:hypothetical protein CQW23_19066 [Capsicum baccatum]
MAAYTAVISLLQTLEQRNPKLIHAQTSLESLHATAEYFQLVLEKISSSTSRSDPEMIKFLDEKIRVAASDAEDVIELKMSSSFGILQNDDLLPVVEKVDTTTKQVMEIVSNFSTRTHDADDDNDQSFESTNNSIMLSNLEDEIVRGLDDYLEKIVERLRGPQSDLDIVTISGMGGIDALHCISKQTNFVNGKDYDKMDDNELADLVQKNLKGRRYLVVVDDIWSTDISDSTRQIFTDYNNRSLILLTTKDTNVAMFGPKHDFPPELEKVGKKIVEKSQGLPLMISVIAGHPSKMARTLHIWNDVVPEIIASHPDKCLGVLVSGEVWRLSDEDKFGSLKLLFSELYIKRWEATCDSFPNLKCLVLKKCDHLKEITTDFGEICTLESIELHNCGTAAEDSARTIEQEQADMGNNCLKVYIHSNHNSKVVEKMMISIPARFESKISAIEESCDLSRRVD